MKRKGSDMIRTCIYATTAIITSATMGAAMSADKEDGHTTVVQDENGTSVITQSGDPANAEVRIERSAGRTTVYRRNGGNTAVVTQGTGAADIPPEMRELFNRLHPK